MKSGNWTAIGSVVQGAIHVRQDAPCQDALYIQVDEHYTIACVADGHGSASCPYSSDGAQAAVQVAAKLLASMLEKDLTAAVISAQKEIWLPRQLETHWKEAVRTIHAEKGRDDADPFPYIQYGTTLLTIAATASFVFALQIGDGDILMIDQSGNARLLLPMEEKVGEDTESLCLTDAWKYIRTQIIPWNSADGAPLFLLSTDGYANGFANTAGFVKAGVDFLQLWKDEGMDYINKNLPDWLRLSSEKGSGDDIALALVGFYSLHH